MAYKGKKLTEEHKRKIGDAQKRFLLNGGKHSKGSLGKHWTNSELTRRKISESNKGKHFYWKGKKMSEEHKKKIKESNKGKHSGENSNFWKGGIYNNPYSNDWTEILREAIRQRDNFSCQMCGIHQDELSSKFKKLSVHHIDYDKKNCNPNNLISLCYTCHLKTNFNREFWVKYFE